MKQKYVSIILAIALTASMCFSGCGNQNTTPATQESKNEATKESAKESATQVESAEESKPVELEEKAVQIWLMGNKQADTEKVWDAFNELLKEYVPNTTVEFELISDAEYKEKFTQMLASGEPVDAAWHGWLSGTMSQQISDGNYMPLNDLIEEYGQGIIDTLGEDVVEFDRRPDGELYYLTSWQGLASNKRGFAVITELAELAGDTWIEDTQAAIDKWRTPGSTAADYDAVFDQLEKYLVAAKEAGKYGAGAYWSNLMKYGYAFRKSEAIKFYENCGLLWGDNSFEVVDSINTEHYRTFAKNIAEFYEKGYIRSDIASVNTGNFHVMKDGVIDDNTYIMLVESALGSNAETALSLKWGADATILEVEKEACLSGGSGTCTIIPYCADEPERVMMVLNAIYSVPELYQLLCWGIEGEHYTDNGDGTVNFTGGTSSQDSYGVYEWMIGSCINALTTQNMVPGYYDEMKELEATAYITPFKNFSFDDSEVKDIRAALSAVDKEYLEQIHLGIHGDNWEEVYDRWIAERKAAGVDKLIAEMQRQVDEFVKANNITSY